MRNGEFFREVAEVDHKASWSHVHVPRALHVPIVDAVFSPWFHGFHI
jgi:hypothetical protein